MYKPSLSKSFGTSVTFLNFMRVIYMNGNTIIKICLGLLIITLNTSKSIYPYLKILLMIKLCQLDVCTSKSKFKDNILFEVLEQLDQDEIDELKDDICYKYKFEY